MAFLFAQILLRFTVNVRNVERHRLSQIHLDGSRVHYRVAPRILPVDNVSSSTYQDGFVGYEVCFEMSFAEVDEDDENGWIDSLHIEQTTVKNAKGETKVI